jgi:hypothetical protein
VRRRPGDDQLPRQLLLAQMMDALSGMNALGGMDALSGMDAASCGCGCG